MEWQYKILSDRFYGWEAFEKNRDRFERRVRRHFRRDWEPLGGISVAMARAPWKEIGEGWEVLFVITQTLRRAKAVS